MRNTLHILWTNDNPITSEKMICMYARNAMLNKWWDAITVILWGATVQYAATDESIQRHLAELMKEGVKLSACRSCAEQLGLEDKIRELNIELKYWGEPLTELLKGNEKLITI